MKYAVLAGRQLFSIIFIVASAGHLHPETIASAARHSVPLPHILVPLSGVIALLGGLSILFGYQTRIGAWLLVIFLVPVTVMMHNFWAVADPAASMIERAMFLRNVTMLGGALLISYFGAGPLSVDALLESRSTLSRRDAHADSGATSWRGVCNDGIGSETLCARVGGGVEQPRSRTDSLALR